MSSQYVKIQSSPADPVPTKPASDKSAPSSSRKSRTLLTVLLLVLLGVGSGVGTWAGLKYLDHYRNERHAQELMRAARLLGEQEQQRADEERAITHRKERIGQLSQRLETLRTTPAMAFRVHKQFGAEGSKGVYESYLGLDRCVLVTDQDFRLSSLSTNISRKVTKRGRQRFVWTTTFANGVQNEQVIFADVYESLSEQEIKDLQRELNELKAATAP